ncbi:cyclic 2,3-diphosphoglycerate synthase [Nitrospira defluvii]|uniref:GTPase n=1 Tax=Nitrospira defluvii TaxID=330214 RepID=A0ABN7LQK3_9BACT|nr:cyclic 2,3-diphosphoglycerate synthase [Nitrospira defluvii]CAE6759923.1 GTPase [Nitrospira defluvii]
MAVDNRAKHEGPRVLIMGAAGRDFHNFNVRFRDNPDYRVMAFTAAQIPNIADRLYPASLAGSLYPSGIPIYPEQELDRLIRLHHIELVVFAYSDIAHESLMRQASVVLAAGADFSLLGPRSTMLSGKKPVVSVCATRTGAGKSPVARRVVAILQRAGLRVATVRHPMPYGDLVKQAVQRFDSLADLDAAGCTIEEREEYEPHVAQGCPVYAGVDYGRILHEAEGWADIIVWDGGNNDWSFFVPDLEIVLLDPHRADEQDFFPGEVNLLRADVVVLTKLDTATSTQVAAARRLIERLNPRATLVETVMPLSGDESGLIAGKRVLVIEDGPTLTHGGMAFGAGYLMAERHRARAIVDPRPSAVGSLNGTFQQYPHIGPVLPAMGYGPQQIRDLEETIRSVDCDLVVIATPVDLRRLIRIAQPTVRVRYDVEDHGRPTLADVLQGVIRKAKGA